MLLTDVVQQVDVAVEASDDDDLWLVEVGGFRLAEQLRRFQGPKDLLSDLAMSAVNDRPQDLRQAVARTRDWLSPSDDGELISTQPITVPVRMLYAAAAPVSGTAVTAEMSMEGSAEGGISLTLGGLGMKSSAKYTVKRNFKVECAAGEAKEGLVLIPAILEERSWRPEGAVEDFIFNRVVPIPSVSTLGVRANVVPSDTLLLGKDSDRVEIGGGTAGFTDSLEKKLELSFSLELSVGWGLDEKNKLGITAGLSGAVELKATYTVPAGQFDLYWLTQPAGARIVSHS